MPHDLRADQVAITGLSIICPLGDDPERFWQRIVAGECGLAPSQRLDLSALQSKMAGEVDLRNVDDGLRPSLRRRVDLASRVAVSVAQRAVRNAGLDLGSIDPYRVGVVMGTCLGGLANGRAFHEQWIRQGIRRTRPSLLVTYSLQAPVDLIAHVLGARGVKAVISNACAAGGNAIGLAYDSVRSGQADVVVAGGVDVLDPFSFGGFHSLQALDAEGCAPYSRSNGITISEGAAFLVLESLAHAEQRGATVHGIVGGYALSADAYHPTAPDPSGGGAARAMSAALRRAGLTPDLVDYVNGHGTGTKANDEAEMRAMKQLFAGRQPAVPISSTKSQVGHAMGAAGAIEAVTSVLALQHQQIPPTINCDPALVPPEIDCVPNVGRPHEVNVVLSNSFAFGGNNCTLVLQRSPAPQPMANPGHRVWVTGLGVVSGAANERKPFWDWLAGQELAYGPVIGFDATPYGCRLGGRLPHQSHLRYVDPALVRRLDPLSRYAVAAARMAVADGHLRIGRHNAESIGVVFGTGSGPVETVEAVSRSILEEGIHKVNPRHFPNTVMNAAAGHVCLSLQVKGPTSTLVTGGVAGTQAITYAADMIRNGMATAVIAICADEYNEWLHGGCDRLGMLSRTTPRIYDQRRDGAVLAGGAVAVLLERADEATERSVVPLGEIRAHASTGDAIQPFDLPDDGEGLAHAMSLALARSGLTTADVGCVVGDARGSQWADAVEVDALRRTFGDRLPPVASVNGRLGYTQGASGGFQMASALAVLATGTVPGVPDLEQPIFGLQASVTAQTRTISLPEHVLISSMSHGGTYISLILSRA